MHRLKANEKFAFGTASVPSGQSQQAFGHFGDTRGRMIGSQRPAAPFFPNPANVIIFPNANEERSLVRLTAP
jgi:hypothetical protein